MTREEAKEILNNTSFFAPSMARVDEAIDMAISALHFEADCRSCMWREKCEELTEQTEPSDKGGDAEMNETKSPFMQQTPSEDGSDLISRAELLKPIEESWKNAGLHSEDYHKIKRWIKKAPSVSANTPTESTNTPTDLISKAEALAYPLSFDHYDKENGSREFICGVESYREYIQHLPSVKKIAENCENLKPLVRCKDCEYSSWNKYSNSLDCYHFADGDVDDNDFCSRAKMKGGEE